MNYSIYILYSRTVEKAPSTNMLVATGAKTGAEPELDALAVDFRDICSAIYPLLNYIPIIFRLNSMHTFYSFNPH